MRPPVCPAVPPEVMQLAWFVVASAVVLVGIMVIESVVNRRRK